MEYFVLRDIGEFVRYDYINKTLEVYRGGEWIRDPKLSAIYSGDEPIRNVTEAEREKIRQLGG